VNIQLFNVKPAVPAKLRFLEDLAQNMWWCWDRDANYLFRRINPQLWRESGHNPLIFLSRVPQGRLEALAEDEAYVRSLSDVRKRFDEQVGATAAAAGEGAGRVAYFSLEYGIHESLRFYSGGLGVLAGDHLKAASDLGAPLVAVGLLYRDGYFRQYLNRDGWQQERYPSNAIHQLPLRKAGGDTSQVVVSLPLPAGVLKAIVWRLDVGRVPLYLLDTNIPENPPELRDVTARLYGGGRETRLRQELLLGICGFHALLALGYDPHVCHINEGHAAFLSLARIAHLVKTLKIDIDTAHEIVRRTSVFTTHTPVPAGNESFAADLVAPHLKAVEPLIGVPHGRVMAWGTPGPGQTAPELSMTVLGLHTSRYANGVSRLHGAVARRMWSHLWPERSEDEVPIDHVTNGVHVPSWISDDMEILFERYLGPQWQQHPAAEGMLSHVAQIPDEELWRAHELARSRLIRFVREWTERQFEARNESRATVAQAKSVLDQDVLTVGFARRFATYKRGVLLLRDRERLEALLTNEERPVQLLFAGKAHPADEHGKDFIRRLVEFARRSEVRRRIVFLEDYDIELARRLIQGVDVWLNTPRRPMEASGTSGMKAAVNGALNVSTLDGWWCEGYTPDRGWAIGAGEEYEDHEYQDVVESQALYNLLENQIVPCFYERELGEVPTQWVQMMKHSIRMGLGFFTSHRMVAEYDERFYRPALQDYRDLTREGAKRAAELVVQHQRLTARWHTIGIDAPAAEKAMSDLHVGDSFVVTTRVRLGELQPEEVEVQVVYGPVDSQNRMSHCCYEPMEMAGQREDGGYEYRRQIRCERSGRYGFTTRVTAAGEDWKTSMPGFLTWAETP